MPADRPKRLLTVATADPRGLLAFLQARLAIGARAAQQLIAEGAVFVGRKRAQLPTLLLVPGARVTVYTAAAHPPGPAAPPALQIALTDKEVLVVDKPAGLDTQPGRRGGPSLLALLPPHAVLLHRLDAEASGLLLCARTPVAGVALQHALLSGEVTREYVAVVNGTPPESGQIELRIGPRAQSGPMAALRQCYPMGSPHGLPALTRFQTAGRTGPGAAAPMMLLVQLQSGRTHQIRVHLAALGFPILGDLAYGGPAAARLLLHAVRLRFRHPRTGQLCQVISPLPPEFGWPAELVSPPRSASPGSPSPHAAPGHQGPKDRVRALAAALDTAFPKVPSPTQNEQAPPAATAR